MNKSTKSKKGVKTQRTIVLNKKARHDYHIEAKFEAGIVLLGWEVKSLRAGHCQIKESHIVIKKGEVWLLGAHISPLASACTHISTDPVRTRKLLLHKREINKLVGATQKKGYTIVPLAIYWKKQYVKIEIALAKGKKLHDKRRAQKEKDWSLEKARLMRNQQK